MNQLGILSLFNNKIAFIGFPPGPPKKRVSSWEKPTLWKCRWHQVQVSLPTWHIESLELCNSYCEAY